MPPRSVDNAAFGDAVLALRKLSVSTDRVASEVAKLQREVSAVRAILEKLRPEGVREVAPKALAEPALLQAEAVAGVARLERTPNPDGSVLVSVNGRRPVRLTASCAAFLELLATRERAADGMTGWCSVDDVVAGLDLVVAPASRRRAVNVVVHRLRKALAAAGENRHLVVRDRSHAVRIALRSDRA